MTSIEKDTRHDSVDEEGLVDTASRWNEMKSVMATFDGCLLGQATGPRMSTRPMDKQQIHGFPGVVHITKHQTQSRQQEILSHASSLGIV